MYIAFRWLLFLTLFMWFALCWIEESKKYHRKQYEEEESKKQKMVNNNHHEVELITFFNSIMFIFGALTVILCSKRAEIVIFLKNYNHNKLLTTRDHCVEYFKRLLKFLLPIWVSTKICLQHLRERAPKLILQIGEKIKEEQKGCQLNDVLAKNLTRLKTERDNMVKVCIAAMKTNKCIRKKYILESTECRQNVIRHIADSNLQLKENKVKISTNFYRLYMKSHQENMLLKARLRSAVHERDGAHDLLRQLVKEIFKTNNIQLKLFCIRFATHLGDNNLVNANHSEQANSRRSECDKPASSKEQLNETESLHCAASRLRARVNEMIRQRENDLVKSNKPFKQKKNKNNRYIWTVQNQDGLIENVYEYYDEFDQTKTVNVKRIRQYSVYHNRDCIIDLSNSTSSSECNYHLESSVIEFPTNPRFLTNSQAFQNFLRNYNSIALQSRI